jgi:hypothetical protein
LHEGLDAPSSGAPTPAGVLRFGVVGWATGAWSPRGQRAEHLAAALRRHGEVERIGPRTGERAYPPAPLTKSKSFGHRIARMLVHHVFIDRFEPAVSWRFFRWRPNLDAAVLVGFPFSPLAYASRRLVSRDVPYVVDIGDPWALTDGGQAGGLLSHSRAVRAERCLWRHARGAIVTTPGQAQALSALFPQLPILVRPNGYEPAPAAPSLSSGPQGRHDASVLRLVHYGSLYGSRLDFEAFAAALAASGRWKRIVLRQHGHDWSGSLDRIARHIDVEWRPALSWPAVLQEAPLYDAALVIGNHNPAQLPSKAVQYLTLPIPRVALVTDDSADALTCYVADKSAWAVVRASDPDPSRHVAKLVNRRWETDRLTPPQSESWSTVEAVLRDFILTTAGIAPK